MNSSDYREEGLTPDILRQQALRSFTPFTFASTCLTLPFRMSFPQALMPGKRYPLLLLLHGAGSVGRDNILPLFFAELYARHPLSLRNKAFILAPQCPTSPHWIEHGDTWDGLNYSYHETPTAPMLAVMELLDYLLKAFPIDSTRLAVGGCSMGGYGTWDLLSRRPGMFKAAFPICGCGDPRRQPDYATTELWFFHGALDRVVSPLCSQRMAQALTKAKKSFQYTEFPQADHDSWTPALAQNDLHRWLAHHLLDS